MARYLLSLLFLLGSIGAAQSQIGINLGYRANTAPGWRLQQPQAELLYPGQAPVFGLDYWFRLKQYRVEFTPELSFSAYKAADSYTQSEVKSQWLGLYFHTNLYLLDLAGDCDCPTWSKQGPTLQKGLFLRLSPGISWVQGQISQAGASVQRQQFWAPSGGVGLGFDIGLSDFLTVTPLAQYHYVLPTTWAGLSQVAGDVPEVTLADERSSVQQWQLGLRIGLRFGGGRR